MSNGNSRRAGLHQSSHTICMQSHCGPMYITVLMKDGKMDGIHTFFGKAGGCGSAIADGVSSLVSELMKGGIESQKIVNAVAGIGCHLGRNTCMSAISSAIKYVDLAMETGRDINDIIEEAEFAEANTPY